MDQQNLFQDNHGTININPIFQSDPSPSLKKDESQNVKMSSDLKKWLTDTSAIISDATGEPKYGCSTLAYEGLSFFRQFFGIRKKLVKYEKCVVAMLENLP